MRHLLGEGSPDYLPPHCIKTERPEQPPYRSRLTQTRLSAVLSSFCIITKIFSWRLESCYSNE